jgi:FkbM family methyltransferase
MLHYDGYRNFGLRVSDLGEVESRQRAVAARCLETLRPRAVWDVGANVGMWTLWLAAHAGASCTVCAFEPDPRNLEILDLNVTHNALSGVVVRSVALSSAIARRRLTLDETGTMNSLQPRTQSRGGPGVVEIETTTVDEEIRASGGIPGFVKLDVEGHEYDVLMGASSLLSARETVILLEITDRGPEVMQLLHGAGYRVYGLDGQEIERAEYYVVASPFELRPVERFFPPEASARRQTAQ